MTSGGVIEIDERALKASAHRRLVDEHVREGIDVVASPVELRRVLAGLIRDEAPLLPVPRLHSLVDDLVREVVGLGPLEPLLADPEVSEVMINGPGRAWVERGGRVSEIDLGLDAPGIERIVERVVAPLGLRFDRTAPVVDARLPDGSRLHAVLPPVAVDGPYVTIRRFTSRVLPLSAFGDDPRLHRLLRWAVTGGWNVLVSGGTSSGKTTLLNSLAGGLPAGDRIVTIEETAELRVVQPNVVRLEARPANAEGAGAVTVQQLVRAALRMRPERIVIGEVRGAEALDMIEALNTGHDGSLSTIHANGPAEALLRLETLALRAGADLPSRSIRAHVASSIDAVVQVRRGADGARQVVAVAEVGPAVGGGLRVRDLWTAARGLVAVPGRPPRRAGALPFDAGEGQQC